MNELLFSEYERISENLELCLKGFEDICQYCKNLKEIPKEVQVIGFIIENTISKLKKGEENNG